MESRRAFLVDELGDSSESRAAAFGGAGDVHGVFVLLAHTDVGKRGRMLASLRHTKASLDLDALDFKEEEAFAGWSATELTVVGSAHNSLLSAEMGHLGRSSQVSYCYAYYTTVYTKVQVPSQ